MVISAVAATTTLLVGAWRADRAVAVPAGSPPEASTLTLDVLVPARDEAVALPGLLACLGAQDWRGSDGRPAFRVVVIDDGSADDTADVARRAAAEFGLDGAMRVVRRPIGSQPDGKGAALAFGHEAGPAAGIVVLDADAWIDQSFLRSAASRLASGGSAFTARRRLYRADASLLAAAQAAEQDLDGLQLRARIALGGAGEFRGNGMVLTAHSLAEAGSWPAGSLTEDLDISTRLAAAGRRVAWAGELVAWEAPAASATALARQRLRWAEGSLRRLFALLPLAMASRRMPLPAKIDLAIYSAQSVLSPVVFGTVVAGCRCRRPGIAALLLAAYGAVAVTLTMAALEPAEMGARSARTWLDRRSVRAVVGGAFAMHWLVAVPAALVRIALRSGPPPFDQTRDRLLLAASGWRRGDPQPAEGGRP